MGKSFDFLLISGGKTDKKRIRNVLNLEKILISDQIWTLFKRNVNKSLKFAAEICRTSTYLTSVPLQDS